MSHRHRRWLTSSSYRGNQDAVPIDPIELKLDSGTYETQGRKGLFGALRDSSPDYWGRRVIERHAKAASLSELHYLLHSPDDRAGALGFGLNAEPPAPLHAYNRTMNLEKLQKVADAIIADEEVPQDDPDAHQAHELLGGTSMGGARPKAVVEDDDGLWIAKFNRNDDNWNYAKIERAMLMLATEFGSLAQQALIQRLLDESDWWPRRVFDEVLRQSVPGTQEAPQRMFACDDAGQLVA